MRTDPRVLVVESDPEEAEVLGSRLEASGFDVIACPGPIGPDFVCVGDRTGSCPLIDSADIVVLDCRLESDQVLEGTSAYDLLALYVCSGRPVVAIGGDEAAPLFAEDDVTFLERGSTGDLLEIVERAVVAMAHDENGVGACDE